ncbi:MAG: glycosyltransferase family 1 protein [Armatimonadota bacterium]|nr:glycosyltransferase family 4 protein [bacterium]
MKVLLDATVLERPLDGVGTLTIGLYRACLAIDPDLTVIAVHQCPPRVELPQEIKTIGMGTKMSGRWWRRLVLPATTATIKPQIVHFPNNGHIPLGIKSRKVMILHDVFPLILPGYLESDEAVEKYKMRVQRDINRCDLLVTVSEISKKDIMAHFDLKTEPIVIPAGCRYKPSARKPALKPKVNPYFLNTGGYDPERKGLDVLIPMFIQLHDSGRLSSRLVITGSRGWSNKMAQVVADGVRRGIIEDTGCVSDEKMLNLYENALGLVYPSRYEGFGMPPLEAMTLGCPVITTRNGSLPEVCGEAVRYVDLSQTRDFADALVNIENNTTLRHELQVKGFLQATKYSWANSAATFLSALEKLTS